MHLGFKSKSAHANSPGGEGGGAQFREHQLTKLQARDHSYEPYPQKIVCSSSEYKLYLRLHAA